VSGAAFSSNILSLEQVNKVIDKLVSVNIENPQVRHSFTFLRTLDKKQGFNIIQHLLCFNY